MEIVWKNNIIQLMMVYNNYEECGKEQKGRLIESKKGEGDEVETGKAV